MDRRGHLLHPDVDPARFALQFGAIWSGLPAQWLVDPSFDLAAELVTAFRALTRHDAVVAKRAIAELVADM